MMVKKEMKTMLAIILHSWGKDLCYCWDIDPHKKIFSSQLSCKSSCRSRGLHFPPPDSGTFFLGTCFSKFLNFSQAPASQCLFGIHSPVVCLLQQRLAEVTNVEHYETFIYAPAKQHECLSPSETIKKTRGAKQLS